jgi:hypothetical protein
MLKVSGRGRFTLLSGTALTAVTGVIAATVVAAAPPVLAADPPGAFCTTSRADLDLRLGGGIPLPHDYSNPTSSTVKFTLRMTANRFFGPAHDIGSVTLPPETGRTDAAVELTSLHTPLGEGDVSIEVRTDRTGDQVVGRCDYTLRLAAPVPAPNRIPRWLLQVPVQMCAVEGSQLAAGRQPGQLVAPGQLLETLAAVNDTVWYPKAQVAFSTATESVIPVIADPIPPAGGNGQLGDIHIGTRTEAGKARDLCSQAWQAMLPRRPGIPVINSRDFVGGAALGVAPGPPLGLYVASHKAFSGQRGDDLCGFPLRLSAADVSGNFVVMKDQRSLGSARISTLAHELGHNLFLGHGNGLDDNQDGLAVGSPGPRRYDEYCDPAWLAPPQNVTLVEDQGTPTPCSLMHHFSCSLDIRPLQIETARGVARVVPGAVDGTE